MSFVNQYTNPEYSFIYAEEFVENNDRFVYGVGYSSKGPVIVKSTTDGQSVWEHLVTIQLETKGFRLQKIVQLRIKETIIYLISAYDGTQSVLLSINSNGNLNWTNEIDYKASELDSFLVATFDQRSVFFVYTDKTSFNGIATPIVIQVGASGAIIKQASLQLQQFKSGIEITSVKSYEKGIVLAAHSGSKQPQSLIIDMNYGWKFQGITLIDRPNITIQDLLVRNLNDYVISAYSEIDSSVIVSKIQGFGSFTYTAIPNSSDASSIITEGNEGLYVFANYNGKSEAYKLANDLTIEWYKKFKLANDLIMVNSACFDKNSAHVTISTSSPDLLARLDDQFESCIAESNNFNRPKTSKLNAKQTEVIFKKSSVKVIKKNAELIQTKSEKRDICGEGFALGKDFLIQSEHLYIQSAGSLGNDSTKGMHLRWMLKGGLSTHLPKANYAIPNVGFNKANDFVRVFRTPYIERKAQIDFTVVPNLVDDVKRSWAYNQGETVYLKFLNTSKYDQVRVSINPMANPTGFLAAYGNEVIEIDTAEQLSFAVTMAITSSSPTSLVSLELLSVDQTKLTADKRVTLRQNSTVQDLNGKKLLSDNIRSIRLKGSSFSLNSVEFEFYSRFITDSLEENSWSFIGKYALTKDTPTAFNRLEPQANVVQDNWLRYNDDAYVNIDNYKTKWNSPTLDPENRIIETVDRYIDLSNDPTNPTAIEEIYFNDPTATPIPGFEPDPDFDPSENQFDLSNLYVLQLASMDYHIARMLGLGVLDLNPVVFTGEYIYIAEYVSIGDLDDGLGVREVQHLYCSLPTGLADERLPLPIDLKVPVPGIFQDVGTENPTPITDEDGYSADGKSRFISLFHEELPEETENAPFFDSNFEFVSADGTIPVYAGIEYRNSGLTDWQKPELPYDGVYLNIDATVPAIQRNETRPIVIPESEFPLFIHREKTGGFHDYSSYGINWFSRATSSGVVHTIETVIEPTNLLQPPTNINAVLIRNENPLLLTSADERTEYLGLTTTDRTFIRLAFDYNHGQELIDYHKAINGELVKGYSELPDAQELFAEDIEIFYRNETPLAVSGKVISVVDDSNPLLSIVTTGEFELTSQTPTESIIPDLNGTNPLNFVGSVLVINGVEFLVHQVDDSGTYPVFTVFKNDGDGFPVALSSGASPIDLSAPTSDELFVLVENMLNPPSWFVPGPMSFKINTDLTTVHREEVDIKIPDGTIETHVQKFRGVYEDALIEEELEDDDGDAGTANVHLGLYKLTFSGYSLPNHSQAGGSIHRIDWYKGIVRVHTTDNPTAPRKELVVIKALNIGTSNDLIVYAVDLTFDDVDPDYDKVLLGTHTVNYYPGYRAYLFEDSAFGINNAAVLPGVDEDIRYSIFGLRSHDAGLGFVSKISQPVIMFAQKIVEPLQPNLPDGGKYATRPDFFGKASYTFTTEFLHKPYSVQYSRASNIQILSMLWERESDDPTVWTVPRIQTEIFDNGNDDWYDSRWNNLIGFDYTYTSNPSNNGNFEEFDLNGTNVSLPLPNNEAFISSINAFIDRHDADYGTTLPQVTTIASLYDEVIPATSFYGQLLIVDFVRDIVHNCFVPLTEIPVIYEHIKGLTYSPIPKKQVIRDENGDLLPTTHGDFDMAPMMKIIGPDVGAGITSDQTQFTDFGLDGSSNAKYFYISREFNLQMKTGPYSPIWGPIRMVNAAPPRAAEIVKVTPLLGNDTFGILPSIKLEINRYSNSQNIKKIHVYRTTSPQNALSIRTMDLVKTIDDIDLVGIRNDATWTVHDDFGDIGYVPYGDPLFYSVIVDREVKYNDRDNNLVTEYQPSEPSKMVVTNIVEHSSPEAPQLVFYSDPINVSFELDNCAFKWNKMVRNGSYHLYKRNAKGSWVKIYEIQSNADEIVVNLMDTDLADGTLATQNAEGNTIYHIFKVVSQNFAGMTSIKENIASIYNVDTWNDISTI